MKIGAIIQARTASTRLPGKVLLELPYGSGTTVLQQVVCRLRKSKLLDEIIIATTTSSGDDHIVEISHQEGVKVFRGSERDVLARYYYAAVENSLDVIVRITSDCPCIDPQIVDQIIKNHLNSGADYTSNTLKRTFAHGLDTEVFSFKALEQTFGSADKEPEREHVTPYIYMSGLFTTRNIEAPNELSRPDIRITLDTAEDYALLCALYDFLYKDNQFFGASEIIGLFDKKPWIGYINARIIQKKIFKNIDEELVEAVRVLDMQDLKRARDLISERLKK